MIIKELFVKKAKFLLQIIRNCEHKLEMPIQLDKILGDIANEKVLHPNYQGATKKEIDDAWSRVGNNSNLSGNLIEIKYCKALTFVFFFIKVHESRSIFKVLQKKYEQEKLKDSSAWKLFGLMDQIHKKVETKSGAKEELVLYCIELVKKKNIFL